MAGMYTPGLPVLSPADFTGDELFAVDTQYANGQSPQTAAVATSDLLLGQAALAAAGASQGNASLITAAITMVSVTASTQGVKLPAAATGLKYLVMAPTAKGVKVYPNTGDSIGTTATNSAVALVLNKSSLYIAESASKWRVLTGG